MTALRVNTTYLRRLVVRRGRMLRGARALERVWAEVMFWACRYA